MTAMSEGPIQTGSAGPGTTSTVTGLAGPSRARSTEAATAPSRRGEDTKPRGGPPPGSRHRAAAQAAGAPALGAPLQPGLLGQAAGLADLRTGTGDRGQQAAGIAGTQQVQIV